MSRALSNFAIVNGLWLAFYLFLRFAVTGDEVVLFLFPGPGWVMALMWFMALGELLCGVGPKETK